MPCTKKMSMKSVGVSNMNVKRIKVELQNGPKNGPNGSKLSTKRGPKWGVKEVEVKLKRHLKRRDFKDQKSAPRGYQEQNSETCRSNEREAP